jgi:hypothetical protein
MEYQPEYIIILKQCTPTSHIDDRDTINSRGEKTEYTLPNLWNIQHQ